MASSLNDRVAVVTGAGRGIGRATAEALARRGARVLAVARTESELVDLSAGTDVQILVSSIAEPEACASIIEHARRRLGPIDILVNNAGIGSADEREIWAQDPAVWHNSMGVNLHAPFELTRLASRDMIERRGERIIMVSSPAGQVGGPQMSAYCASKHGLLGLMRSVAHDVAAYNVTCNAVCPGWVRTAMSERKADKEAAATGLSTEEVWRERAASSPAGRVVREDEVAATIAFLASEEASGINGEAIVVALGRPW